MSHVPTIIHSPLSREYRDGSGRKGGDLGSQRQCRWPLRSCRERYGTGSCGTASCS